MPGQSSRSWTLAVAIPAVALVATMALARPQEPKESAKAVVTDGVKERLQIAVKAAKYYGAKSCIACHRPGNFEGYPESAEHVKLTEYAIWRNEDKHSLAFEMLSGTRGKAMSSRLGLDVTKRETGCLGCHSASPAEIRDRAKQGDAFTPSDGVSCENCHGPAEKWNGPHFQSDWREKSPEEKASLGMNDLRDPVRQAAKCQSCHVGNVEEGKVVTHAMYAVGHPPLPSIDVAFFGDRIPRHWRMLDEKPQPQQKLNYYKAEGSFERSRLAIVGSGMALNATMKLMGEETRGVDSKTPGLAWPDYARFDCASCHHELERPSWRQERGFDGPPGRPVLNRWPLVLLSLGIDRLTQDDPKAKSLFDELKAHEASLAAITRARPFGRKDELVAATGAFANWAEGLSVKLSKVKFDDKSIRGMLHKLLTEASDSDLDYEAARYVAWTASSFLKDLNRDPMTDERIKPIFARLVSSLHLDLPTGQKAKIEDSLPNALQTMGDYNPRQFRADLKELLPLLPQ